MGDLKNIMAQGVKKSIQKEDAKLMGRFYDSLNDTIGNLQSFDENLKLKLTLNLELIQQDQKCWEKHLEEKKLAISQG